MEKIVAIVGLSVHFLFWAAVVVAVWHFLISIVKTAKAAEKRNQLLENQNIILRELVDLYRQEIMGVQAATPRGEEE